MKKLFNLLVLILFAGFAGAQSWIGINSGMPKPAETELINGNIQSSTIHLKVHGYSYESVALNNGMADVIKLENASRLLAAGAPDLLKVTASVIIPDAANMIVNVTSSTYTDFYNVNIAPSKGNLTRDIDPATVPYTFGPEYSLDQFYPGTLAELNDPYIMRDFRGQTVVFYPYQYNPVTKVLRVYTDIIVNISQNGTANTNVFSRAQPLTKIDREYAEIYKHHFLNYGVNHKYTPLDENGRMLIICYDSWMSAMQPFVNWKITEGIPCDMVSVTTAGGTAANIKNYVLNYYNTNGLTFLLLVGDAAQVPVITASGGASDPSYGYLAGSDHYQEIFVGRFSAESVAHVQTQVERTLDYEITPASTPGKYNRAIGIGSDQGPGDDNEYDYQHIRNLLNQMLGFTYTTRAELFDGAQGGVDASGDPSATMLGNEVNSGAGIITYCGHGSNTSFVTTGFSNTNIASLNNKDVLPFIWAVACVNGNFNATTCFAEAWLRHTYNNQPAGAVATLMSSINQSWNPPMEGQDEMVKILTENAVANIKRTFGGLSVNGIYKMLDSYPSDYNMADTWHIFGDPSLMVRTDDPASMTVTHNPTVPFGATSLMVNCNVPGAKVCLTINYEIIATAYVSGGVANLTFNPLTQLDTITVCVTAFNYIPYLGSVAIVSGNYPNDAAMESILEPIANYGCPGVNVQPKVIIRNFGTNVLTSATVSYTLDGGSPVNQPWSGNLPQYATDTVILPAFPLTLGSHTFAVQTSAPNGATDDNPLNDALTRGFAVANLVISSAFTATENEFCSAPAEVHFSNQSQNAVSYLWDFGDGTTSTDANPVHTYSSLGVYDVTLTASGGVCGNDVEHAPDYVVVGADVPQSADVSSCGPDSFTLTATAGGTINWYDAITGGNLLGTGSTYTTPLLGSTHTYYVENEITSVSQTVGSSHVNTNGSNYYQNAERSLIFDAFVPFTLVSVQVNANSAGTRIIKLVNSSGNTVAQQSVNIPAGVSTVTLNFQVPAGADHELVGSTYCNLYRNDAGCAYPYTIPGVCSITASSASTNPTGYYYFFYNWVVQQPSCSSARIAVTASVFSSSPAAGFSWGSAGTTVNFANTSTNGMSYFWDFGDGITSTDANPSHTYAGTAVYQVMLVAVNDCGNDTVYNTVDLITVGIAEQDEQIVHVYPNPSTGKATLYFGSSPVDRVELYDLTGRVLQTFIHPQQNLKLELSSWGAGTYFVSVYAGNKVKTIKLINIE